MCNAKDQVDQLNLVAEQKIAGNPPIAATAIREPISCIVGAVMKHVGNIDALVSALLACGLSLTKILTCISQGISNTAKHPRPAKLLACLLDNVPVSVPGG
jgi:hypothetical protein